MEDQEDLSKIEPDIFVFFVIIYDRGGKDNEFLRATSVMTKWAAGAT